MSEKLEKLYGKLFKGFSIAVNPFKKVVIKTECEIHKFINNQAIEILKNDSYMDAYYLFSDYILDINKGVVWADKDLKSSGHFYNPDKGEGLYGNSDALTLALEYYDKSLQYWKLGQNKFSMFYLGATAHLIQDMTIPQHANIELLNSHRKYEKFIKKTYMNTLSFHVEKGGYYLNSIEEFIRYNAKAAIKIHSSLKEIKKDEIRFYEITKFILPLAQRTTAGCFLKFYRDAM